MYVSIALVSVAILLLFLGGYHLEAAFRKQERARFHIAGLSMLAGVILCVLLIELQLLGLVYVLIILLLPTSAGYRLSLNRQ